MKNNDYTGLEIAVVGMALKFPEANSPQEFWENLKNQKESLTFFTPKELEEMGVEAALRNNSAFVAAGGGQIPDKSDFDASFFGYSPEEAILMDPQTRVFHQVCYQALEDSGYNPHTYKERIGLYAGASNSFYWEAMAELSDSSTDLGQFATMQLSSKDFLTTKVSHKLNLKGPSVPTQTACSTSLVAVHLASRALLLGECEMALAGGVTLSSTEQKGYLYQEGMILSKDGKCRTFDAEASGTVGGNGAGVVVLKTLKRALADQDNIYGIIKGSAINNDGNRKTGYSAPSVKGQTEVIRSALKFAKVTPETIGYVECHGTATNLGDPIEITALQKALGPISKESVALGCCKPNIGHLDAAAGIAGFIKTVLSLHHGKLLPNINFNTPNPKIDWEQAPFYVNTEYQSWPEQSVKRAGVSSFGIGGTNAHIVLEEAPKVESNSRKNQHYLLPFSAQSSHSLEENIAAIRSDITSKNAAELNNIAGTLTNRLGKYPFNACIVASAEESERITLGKVKTKRKDESEKSIVFVFPGGGAQHSTMGHSLYQQNAVFKKAMDEGFVLLEGLSNKNYRSIWLSPTESDSLQNPILGLPLLFLIEYALAKTISELGIVPAAMLGHSLGEYAAACIAEVMDLKSALALVLKRSGLMLKAEEGAMLSIEGAYDSLLPLPENIYLSAHNSPLNCVVGGTKENISQYKAVLEQEGIKAKLVKIDVASHTPLMQNIAQEFSEFLSNMQFHGPKLPFLSNTSGTWVKKEELNQEYWKNHLLHPVQFQKNVDTILAQYDNVVFLEIGPNTIFTTLLKEGWENAKAMACVNTLPHPKETVEENAYFLEKMGEFWLQGGPIDWKENFQETYRKVPLPTYHYNVQSYWLEKDLETLQLESEQKLIKKDDSQAWYYHPGWQQLPPPNANYSKAIESQCLFILLQPKSNAPALPAFWASAKNAETIFLDSTSGEWQNQETLRFALKKAFDSEDYRQVLVWNNVVGLKAKAYAHQLLSVNAIAAIVDTLENQIAKEGVVLSLAGSGFFAPFGEIINPYGAIWKGVLHSINQESIWIKARLLDIPEDEKNPWPLFDTEVDRPMLALRNGQLWEPYFSEYQLPKVQNTMRFESGGTYLFVGGLGRIARTVVEPLVEQYDANFILTGTDSLDSLSKDPLEQQRILEKQQKLSALQRKKGRVEYYKVDVQEQNALLELVEKIVEKHGTINGVVYGAANTSERNFQTVAALEEKEVKAHFDIKIKGVQNLAKALEKQSYDFCVLMSSISSTMGGIGFGAYAAANAYLDQFAMLKVHEAKPWLSVQWDGWTYVDDRSETEATAIDGLFKMTVEEGQKAFTSLVESGIKGVVVQSLSDLPKRYKRWTSYTGPELENTDSGNAEFERPDLLSAYVAPNSETEKQLSELWSSFFKYEKIGIQDSFFELGGNSLKGMSMIALLHKKMGVKIPVKEFFSLGTIEAISGYLESKTTAQFVAITKAEKRRYYPLSSAQKRVFMAKEMQKDSMAYNETFAYTLTGELDRNKLKNALDTVVQNNDIFRAKIGFVKETPMQEFMENISVTIKELACSSNEIEATIGQNLAVFDLDHPPYFKVLLLEISKTQHVLVLDLHHIITDGTSINLLMLALSKYYNGEQVAPAKLQYQDYAVWQNEFVQSDAYKAQGEFWRRNLAGEIPQVNLPLDFKRPTVLQSEGDQVSFTIPKSIQDELHRLARKQETTLYVVMLSMYTVFLSKLSNQKDVIVASPTAGRNNIALEDMMGLFVNTVLFRTNLQSQNNIEQVIRDTKEVVLNALENEAYPFEAIVETLELERDPSRNPLFDVVFTFQNMDSGSTSVKGLEIEHYAHHHLSTKFDLILAVTEEEHGLLCSFNFSTALFKKSSIEKFVAYFKQLLEGVIKHPEKAIAAIEVLQETEKEKILKQIATSVVAFPEEETVLGLFESQVLENPDNIALKWEDKTYTYQQVDAMATQVAIHLQQAAIKPGTLVALYLSPSVEVVIGILGIIKAGCAYLPIDVHYPEERIAFILEDAQCNLVLTAQHHENTLPKELPSLCIKKLLDKKVSSAQYRKPMVNPDDLLYIIYTSGTTGKPKGVMIGHQNVVRLLKNEAFQFDFSAKDTWVLYHSHSFDFSVWEMYGALLYGGALLVVSKETTRDIPAFVRLVEQQKVTVLNQTPTAFYVFMEEAIKEERNFNLRYVIFGGEALSPGKLNRWHQVNPSVALINMYGITETTVHVTFKKIGANEIANNQSNIGIPIPTLTTYILDENLHLQVPGVPGELCVGGKGVARGYWNRPELTAAKFVDNPFMPGEKLYRSGDLARLLPNGEMEYMGRMDQQVKIRGFRIELGEIEAQMSALKELMQVVVQVVNTPEGEKSLCAYYVPEGTVSIDQIRKQVAKKIPAYMVPSYFVPLQEIPMTPHGKVNTRALPNPNVVSFSEPIELPETEVEKALASIWESVLAISPIGINHNFFHVGGDSIKAIRLVNAINKKYELHLSLADLYGNDTVSALAELLEKQASKTETQIDNSIPYFNALKKEALATLPDPENIEDVFPMTEIELGMVFNYQKNIGSGVYHDQFLFNLSFEDFDLARFEKAISLMVDKHPILRTGFNLKDLDGFAQIVYKKVPLAIEYRELLPQSFSELQSEIEQCLRADIGQPFEEKEYPLWRIKMMQYKEGRYVFLLIFHHAILDGWSVASLMTELNNVYYTLRKQPDFKPEELKSSYKDLAIEEYNAKQDKAHLAFWMEELNGYERLEMSFLSGKDKQGDMQIFKRQLDTNLLHTLEQTAGNYKTDLKTLLFSAYLYTLKLFSNSDEVTAGWVNNNRPVVEDSDKILGCFLNTSPVRVAIPHKISCKEFITLVHNKIQTIRLHDNVPLFEIATAIGEKRSNQNPIFDTLFNFVNFHVYDSIASDEKAKAESEELPSSDGNQNTNTLFDFEVSTTGGDFFLLPKYETAVMDREAVVQFCDYFEQLLQLYIESPETVLRQDRIMLPKEKETLLHAFNATKTPYDRDATLPSLFESAVAHHPNHIAVETREGHYSYLQINEKANRLAHDLIDKGAGTNQYVAIVMDRSMEMIVAMLAVVKAGAAYVPMEPNIPTARMQQIIENLQLSVCITNAPVWDKVAEVVERSKSITTVYCMSDTCDISLNAVSRNLELIASTALLQWPTHNPLVKINPKDTAYIIFTSGSTGEPKGVVVQHQPVINVIEWVNKNMELVNSDKLLFLTSISFDLSVYDVFGILAAGATIRLVHYEEMADPTTLIKIIAEEGITIWDSAPAAIQVIAPLLSHHREELTQSALRLVMLSGDWIPITLPGLLENSFEGLQVVSLGGATEATIWSNYYFIDQVNPEWKSIPYGKPIQNSTYYIYTESMELCPIGVPGDLYIGGECLSKEYVNAPELNKVKFIENPLVKGERIYKTGDQARWFRDGNMEFLGRKDGQVKIRGFRIETGEIATHLVKHESVQDAIVLAYEGANREKYLCAYLVPQDGTDLDFQAITVYLQALVPDYFIPAHFIELGAIPITANGKVDRKNLPMPESQQKDKYVAPSNAIEETLSKHWTEVLELKEPVSTEADFFDLGGHSLNITLLLSLLQKSYGVNISIREIFTATTIQKQAKLILLLQPELQEPSNTDLEEEREQITL